MIRPRWYKVISDLLGNKVRSLLVIASITVGLFAVGLIVSMHQIIAQDMETGYRAVKPANVLLTTSMYEEDLLPHLEKVDGVEHADGAMIFTLRVRVASGEWETIDFKAIPKIEENHINRLRLIEGSWPPNDLEFVVDQYKADKLGAPVGSMFEVETPSGKTRSMKLVGIVNDQTIGATGPGGFFMAPVTAYINLGTLPYLEIPRRLNTVYVTVNQGQDDLEYLRGVSNRVSNKLEDDNQTVYGSAIRASNDHPNRIYVEAISALLILLGFMVMFLSGFLITNTLSALLNQQVAQIGTMKTIGAQRGQIISIYMLLILVFSLIAFAIAAPLATRAAYSMLQFLAGEINMVLQGFRPVPLAIIIQLAIALIVPQLAGFLPILHGTRITAVEAFSGYSTAGQPARQSWIDQRIKSLRLISRPMLLSLRNTFRRKGRLALTLFTLTLGGAIFIGTFSVQRSLADYIDRIGRYFLADVNITTKYSYRLDEMDLVLLNIPGVKSVEAWASAGGEIIMPDGSSSEMTSLLAPPAGSKLVDPLLTEGRWVQPGDYDRIAVNERFHELFPNLKVGDWITLKIDGDKHKMEVVGFFKLAGKSSGFLAYTNYEYLSVLTHQRNRANTFRITSTTPNMTLEQQKALGKVVEARLKARGYDVAEVSAGHALTELSSDGLNILIAFLLIMASLIAMVGSIGLAGTMSMNVMERTREIGISRAIGASDRMVIAQVIVEGALIGLMSWFFGALLAVPISSLMSNAVNLSLFGAAAEFNFPLDGVFLWLLVVAVLAVAASVLPARNAARLTIREVLAYE